MTTKAKTEKQLADEGKTEEEVKFDPSEYACEIILEKTTPDKIISKIDKTKNTSNLSSAIRLYVLNHLKDQL